MVVIDVEDAMELVFGTSLAEGAVSMLFLEHCSILSGRDPVATHEFTTTKELLVLDGVSRLPGFRLRDPPRVAGVGFVWVLPSPSGLVGPMAELAVGKSPIGSGSIADEGVEVLQFVARLATLPRPGSVTEW
jgi:hypothetical protein